MLNGMEMEWMEKKKDTAEKSQLWCLIFSKIKFRESFSLKKHENYIQILASPSSLVLKSTAKYKTFYFVVSHNL